MKQAKVLSESVNFTERKPVVGVFSAGDPRVDQASRERCRNIVKNGRGRHRGQGLHGGYGLVADFSG